MKIKKANVLNDDNNNLYDKCISFINYFQYIINNKDKDEYTGYKNEDPASEVRYLCCIYGDSMNKSFYRKYTD